MDVPPGASASKLGTWVQRVAQDPAATGDVPDEHRAIVEEVAAPPGRPHHLFGHRARGASWPSAPLPVPPHLGTATGWASVAAGGGHTVALRRA